MEYDSDAFGNDCYRFRSETVGLEIVLDRGHVLVAVGEIPQDRQDWLEWAHVLKAYASDVKAYDFDADSETQVKRLSEPIRHYTKLLGGDFGDESLRRAIENTHGKNFLERFQQS